MPELVSILMPAYNAERWIRHSLESAVCQTWPDKEIIVVDDGSSDNTLAIARGFESGSVKVLSQPNRGAAAARNMALSVAQGDWIQWLDADDLLAADKISRQMKRAEQSANGMLLLSSAWGTFFYRPQKAVFTKNVLWADLGPVEWLLNKLSFPTWMSIESWLVSRELSQASGPWDERLSRDDDGEYSAGWSL